MGYITGGAASLKLEMENIDPSLRQAVSEEIAAALKLVEE